MYSAHVMRNGQLDICSCQLARTMNIVVPCLHRSNRGCGQQR